MISIYISEKLGLVYYKLQGEVNSLDIVNAMFHCTSHPKWKNKFDCLIDTKSQTSTIPLTEFGVIRKAVSGYKKAKNAKHAHIVRNRFEYATGKIWETIICPKEVNYKPFIRKKLAYKWLDKDLKEFASFLQSEPLIYI